LKIRNWATSEPEDYCDDALLMFSLLHTRQVDQVKTTGCSVEWGDFPCVRYNRVFSMSRRIPGKKRKLKKSCLLTMKKPSLKN
jgi:hypothetical protein